MAKNQVIFFWILKCSDLVNLRTHKKAIRWLYKCCWGERDTVGSHCLWVPHPWIQANNSMDLEASDMAG